MERTGVVRAHVTSAAPLDPGQQTSVRERLAQLTGKQVHCEYRVEADLIGGLVARIGSILTTMGRCAASSRSCANV